ncbi:MAG: hypothetical protein ACKOSQ_05765 [Planctomycetaceae bacterium]
MTLLLAAPAVADQPLPLAAAMAAAARQIVPTLEKAGVQNVGVLKFRVLDGTGGEPTARLGTINGDLAAQLQTAILLNVARKKPIAVLRDPNAVAAAIPGASHLTPDGQEKLFAASYPLVVGGANELVRPDALLFGVGQLGEDLKTIRVAIAMIRATDREPEKLCEFDASLEAENLAAAGASFVATRGLFTGGQTGGATQPTPEQVAERPVKLASLAADVRAGRRAFPLQDPEAPVTLAISYDGVDQRIEVRDGGAFVAEPRQGQRVVVTLKKTSRDGRRYGVALKVNGENTPRRDTRPDLASGKWVLSDDFPVIPVRGYAIDAQTIQPFVVLSAAESARRAFDYGVDAGTITMTVFVEATGDEPPRDLPNNLPPQLTEGGAGLAPALDVGLLSSGVRLDPTKAFPSLDEAKGDLQGRLAARSRGDGGLIVPSSGTETGLQKTVTFKPVPDPIMSVVIRYYTRP